MHVLGSEEAYFRFPEKEERLHDLLHMFLPLMSGFVHPFDAVQGAFYPTFLGTCTIPLYSVYTLLVLVINADSLSLCIGLSRTWGFQGPTTFPA